MSAGELFFHMIEIPTRCVGEKQVSQLIEEGIFLFTCGRRGKLVFPMAYIHQYFSPTEEKFLKAMFNFLKLEKNFVNLSFETPCSNNFLELPPSAQVCANEILNNSYEIYMKIYINLFKLSN